MKLLFAPWGNPTGWRELFYEFEGEKVKSSTSLRILQETIEPDKTIIVGLDTLAEEGSNYKEVKESAEKKIKEYVSKFGLKNYDILIVPGIGAFPSGIFHGDALDYYYNIIAKVSLNLLEYSDNTLDIHLDLTHSINYQTILTYRAIKEVLELFSIFKEIKFKAYNADPSLPVATDKLFMNIIEGTQSAPKPFDRRIGQRRTIEPIDLNPEERRKLFEKDLMCIREIRTSEILAFIGALYNGLPLALFRFYPDVNNLKEIISKTIEVYENHMDVWYKEKLNVRRNVKFTEDFKMYVFAYLIATLLEASHLISCQKKEVTLPEIEKLKSSLFKFDERFKVRIEDDIHVLRKNLKNKDINKWQIYNEILEASLGEPDKRNFLAHSGFERNIVEIKKDEEELFLRYNEDKIETIADYCQSGLK